MLELIISEILKSSISMAKDLLGNKLKEKNQELLERKRKKEGEKNKRELNAEELSKILLNPNEEVRADLLISTDETYNRLSNHIKDIHQWSQVISFKDLRGSKNLDQVYIELDTYLMPLRTHISSIERRSIKPLQSVIFESERHCVILGQPGSGKTTSMRKLCLKFFNGAKLNGYHFPVLIQFREINSLEKEDTIQEMLFQLFNFDISFSDSTNTLNLDTQNEWKWDILLRIIDELKPIIILEGFDELPTQAKKDAALKEIRQLTTGTRNAKVILTCRTGEFNYNLDFTDTFEISPLTRDQISLFAEKWIGDKQKAAKFVNDIKKSPFSDTAIKPLSLAHLCAIYERIGSIPDRPKTVYKKIVGLLLEEWDEQRSVKRMSKYAHFEADRKFEFLTHLSYHLTISGYTPIFTKERLM